MERDCLSYKFNEAHSVEYRSIMGAVKKPWIASRKILE